MSDADKLDRLYQQAINLLDRLTAIPADRGAVFDKAYRRALRRFAALREARRTAMYDLATARRLLAEAEERARVAEADAWAMIQIAEDWGAGIGDGIPAREFERRYGAHDHFTDVLRAALQNHRGAALLAELEAARTLIHLYRDFDHEDMEEDETDVWWEQYEAALAAYDAARGRAAEREGS